MDMRFLRFWVPALALLILSFLARKWYHGAGWDWQLTWDDGLATGIWLSWWWRKQRTRRANAMALITSCPCGHEHEIDDQINNALNNMTRGLPRTVVIATGGQAYKVPRIYIAAHGLEATELAGLARKYSWTEIVP